MRRARAKPRGWVFSAKDMLDFGDRATVDKALSRLAAKGQLRRVGHGLYDRPRVLKLNGKTVPVDLDQAVGAIARKDGVHIARDGIFPANRLGLTNAVPARTSYLTSGTSKTVKLGGRTLMLKHAPDKVLRWKDRPGDPVARAIHWIGRDAIRDPKVADRLSKTLPDAVKRDVVDHAGDLPHWAAPVVKRLKADVAAA